MVDKNDSLLREVDEELRREQLEKLWEKYGNYILAGAAVIVLIVGGWKIWETRAIAAAEAGGARYEAALSLAKAGKADEADKALSELAKEGGGGYGTLSKLSLAGNYLKAGKNADALALFDEIAQNSSDSLLSEFATLQAAALKVGDADFTEMQNRLNGLVMEGGPWRSAATELLGIAAYKAGKNDEASKYFTQLLGDSKTTTDMAERANMMLSVIKAAELSAKQGQANPAAASTSAAEAPK
jgi:hypothetical protein